MQRVEEKEKMTDCSKEMEKDKKKNKNNNNKQKKLRNLLI